MITRKLDLRGRVCFHARPDLFTDTGTPENYHTSLIANKRDFRQVVSAGCC
ncbi:MAG: hypothetical protein RL077_5003 [Verrucomicrobiota bacterium]|jgi:hypothetical protein